ncbi:MAG: methionine biosynthesis protein MetW [Verrucomicrobiota bacterium]|jgi:SAM-dependent methyltransferase
MKIIVAIANYGTKNLKYLELLLAEYRRMPFQIDIVVLSNEPKDLGSKVKVLVGLPAKNPWSLPFAHKSLFAQHVKDYDLFIYSEDDTLITEKNIRAFLESTGHLPGNQIPGFLRYETSPDGSRHISSAHGGFHWRPESVKQAGPHTFARFTNDHSACYILTREQLERAIASGGFLVPPYESDYDMLCSAATDPYTRCGFTKVINISRMEDFLLPHLPNKYIGVMGTEYSVFITQVEALRQIAAGIRPATSALPNRQLPGTPPWLKNFYESCSQELIDLVPKGARSILSLGIGTGATESELARRDYEVTAIPLDSVICVPAEAAGVKMVHDELMQGLETLRYRRFDCVMVCSLLYLQQEPETLVLKAASLLADGGCLLIREPNFGNVQTYAGRLLRNKRHQGLGGFSGDCLTPVTEGRLRCWLDSAGLVLSRVIRTAEAAVSSTEKALQLLPLRLSATEIIILARRRS